MAYLVLILLTLTLCTAKPADKVARGNHKLGEDSNTDIQDLKQELEKLTNLVRATEQRLYNTEEEWVMERKALTERIQKQELFDDLNDVTETPLHNTTDHVTLPPDVSSKLITTVQDGPEPIGECLPTASLNTTFDLILNDVANATKTLLFSYGASFRGLAFICDQIWLPCPVESSIVIISKDGMYIEALTFDFYTESIVYDRDDKVLMATSSGLVVMGTRGQTRGQITARLSTMSLDDLSLEGDTLVTCNLDLRNVTVFTHSATGWRYKHHFICEPCKGLVSLTVDLVGSKIYLADGYNNKLFKYLLTGELLSSLGDYDVSSGGGIFSLPFICGHDNHHKVLVCESMYDRLQLVSPAGDRSVYQLLEMSDPVDLLVDDNGDVYVLSAEKESYTVTRYSPVE